MTQMDTHTPLKKRLAGGHAGNLSTRLRREKIIFDGQIARILPHFDRKKRRVVRFRFGPKTTQNEPETARKPRTCGAGCIGGQK